MSGLCDCILNEGEESYWYGHTQADHERQRCSGMWTYEPPCGGCINCDMARAYYYSERAKVEQDGAS